MTETTLDVRFDSRSTAELYMKWVREEIQHAGEIRDLVQDFYDTRMVDPYWEAATYHVTAEDLTWLSRMWQSAIRWNEHRDE